VPRLQTSGCKRGHQSNDSQDRNSQTRAEKGVSHHTIDRILKGENVRRKTVVKIVRQVQSIDNNDRLDPEPSSNTKATATSAITTPDRTNPIAYNCPLLPELPRACIIRERAEYELGRIPTSADPKVPQNAENNITRKSTSNAQVLCARSFGGRVARSPWSIRTAARPLDRRAWRGALERSMPRPRPA